MYQIDSSGIATSLPTPAAAGTPGYFTNGNPATATPATVLDADWFNAVMMELVNIVTAASITPTKGTNSQVLTALQALFSQQSQTFGVGQTMTDVSGSRAFNTNYTNTTGKPIAVYVQATTPSGGGAVGLFIAGSESAVSVNSAAGGIIGLTGIVPAGLTYQIGTTGSVSAGSWKELR